MNLDSLREQINAIDAKLQELIEQRAALGKQVAKIKRQQNQPNYVVLEREAQVLKNVKKRHRGEFDQESILRIFGEIISLTRSVEVQLKVSILGPEGTYTHGAALRQFGSEIEAVFRPTIEEVFLAVQAGRAQYGVVPAENSSQGMVDSTLDCLVDSNLHLCGEVKLAVHHALISCAADLSQINTVLAHEQALAQCRKWLGRNLPNATLVPASSNAEAIKQTCDDPAKAAIASEDAAKLYGVNVLRSNIEDFVTNTTRFLVIGKDELGPTGHDKTCILMSNKSEPGSLLKLLEPFARHEINMTKIESHPNQKGNWQYVFFIDFDGHADDPVVVELFKELRKEAPLFKLLGSYPKSAI